MTIPKSLKRLYPFRSNYLSLKADLNLHYVNEGSGEPVVMVHGNPTWSFYYRDLIKELKPSCQVVVPDHIGCGLSDKPQHYEYSLKNHINNFESLIKNLDLKNITLVVHDWGGAIGFGYATKYPQNIKKIVILNTAAFRPFKIPFRINICRTPFLGEAIIRRFNGFALPATFMAVKKRLSKDIREGYLFPYRNYQNRIANARFVRDIPMNSKHPSYQTLYEIENKLQKVSCKKLILWGEKDFCFTMSYFNQWLKIYPEAESFVFKNAGHYVMEDAKEEVIQKVKDFLFNEGS
jgi:haloalkane dehalogenase